MGITYKYLFFEELEAKTKTKQFAVKNKTSGFILGYVKWYAPWRKYCYFINQADIVFDARCLADICNFIDGLMSERKGNVELSRCECGHEARLLYDCDFKSYFVKCTKCGASIAYRGSDAEAIAAWNKRMGKEK